MKNYKIIFLSFVLFVLGYFVYVCQFAPIELLDLSIDLDESNNSVIELVSNEPTVTPEQVALLFPHAFTPLDKQVFYTVQERKEFFDQLGVEYINKHIFDYEPILDIDAHASEKYLSNKNEHDYLTKLYGQDIAMQSLIPMSIRWINQDIGHGVFAEEDIPASRFIGIYGGVVRDRLLVGSKDYAWSYPGQTLEGGRITLDAAEKGNELRLINDGKDPNCMVQYIIGYDNLWYVCYVACKDIKKGEQLLISYGPAYWETRKYKYQELTDL